MSGPVSRLMSQSRDTVTQFCDMSRLSRDSDVRSAGHQSMAANWKEEAPCQDVLDSDGEQFC